MSAIATQTRAWTPAEAPSPTAATDIVPLVEPVSAVVVDTRPLVRAGLVRLAGSALGCDAQGFGDFEQARAELAAHEDLDETVLLLGVRPGEDATRLIGRARPLGIPVICVLGADEAPLIHAALSATADGYLVLELLDRDSLRDAVSAVRAGERAIPLELRRSCHEELGPVITVRCLEVLQLVADGLHDDEIATRVGISASAVRKHIRGAQDRLGARTRTQAVATAMRRGLL